MICPGINEVITLNNATISALLTYPLSCDVYFWGKIFAGIYTILVLTLFFEEWNRTQKPDFVSAAGICVIPMLVLTVLVTPIGIISADVFLRIFVIGTIILILWLIKR